MAKPRFRKNVLRNLPAAMFVGCRSGLREACGLMVPPDHAQFVPFQGGLLRASVLLPNQAALTGSVLRQQLVAMEQAGAFAVTASHARLLTLGSY